MFSRIKRAFANIMRWFRPWEDQADEDRAEEMYRHYTDSLG